MASALWGKYVSEVLREVKFKYDHNGIRQELIEHMEELYEDLQAEGMDAPVAEVMAVEYMGDPQEIGKALHAEHSPLLGWLWMIGRELAAAFLILTVVSLLPTAVELFHSMNSQYVEKTDSALVYTVPLEEEWNIQGERIRLQEARYYEDGTLELLGDSLDWDRENYRVSGLCNHMVFTDEEGNSYLGYGPAEGSVSLGAGIFFRIQLLFENVPEDLENIEFRYDWYGDGKETISLTEGREVAE